MNILITGATGFVGRHLMAKCLDEHYNCATITRNAEKTKNLFGNSATAISFDEKHGEHVKKIEDFNPDAVIHLASYLTASDTREDMVRLIDTNVKFTCAVLDSLKNTNIQHFINTGSFSEYFRGDGQLDPAYLYSATKTASRIFVDYYSKIIGFKYATVIPYTIYGHGGNSKKILDLLCDSLDSKTPLDITGGEQVLDFIHVEDVADSYISILKNPEKIQNCSVIHLGSGEGTSIKDLANMIEKISGRKTNINWGGKEYRKRDIMHSVAPTSRQNHDLNLKPKISLEEGIAQYLAKRGMSNE